MATTPVQSAPAPAAPDLPVLMTLAGIGYGAPGAIAGYIAEAAPVAGKWSVAWMPECPDAPPNFAFLARETASGAHVLAIRGTYPNPFSSAYWDDGDQDSPFGDMVDWAGAPGAAISAGTAKGLGTLLALRSAAGVDLMAAVAALPAGTRLTVTGHSLGGTLTPVLALKITEAMTHLDVYAVSFAGMTPGNEPFAALFNGTALGGKVTRVFNTLDTVAYGWDKVTATHDFYEPAPKGGMLVSAMLLATAARLDLGGYGFTAVGTPHPLPGTVRPVAIGCSLVAYVVENLYQHMPDTYLALLGAPALPFSIVFATILLPADHPAANAPLAPRPPVVYL